MRQDVTGPATQVENSLGLMGKDLVLNKPFPQPVGAHAGLKLAVNPSVLRQRTQMLNGHLWLTELGIGILDVGALFKDHGIGNKEHRRDEHQH